MFSTTITNVIPLACLYRDLARLELWVIIMEFMLPDSSDVYILSHEVLLKPFQILLLSGPESRSGFIMICTSY